MTDKLTLTIYRPRNRQISRRHCDKTPNGTFADIEQGWVLGKIITDFTNQGTDFPGACFNTGYNTILRRVEHWTSRSYREISEKVTKQSATGVRRQMFVVSSGSAAKKRKQQQVEGCRLSVHSPVLYVFNTVSGIGFNRLTT